MPKPGTLPDFILGKKGESHVSESVNACSLTDINGADEGNQGTGWPVVCKEGPKK